MNCCAWRVTSKFQRHLTVDSWGDSIFTKNKKPYTVEDSKPSWTQDLPELLTLVLVSLWKSLSGPVSTMIQYVSFSREKAKAQVLLLLSCRTRFLTQTVWLEARATQRLLNQSHLRNHILATKTLYYTSVVTPPIPIGPNPNPSNFWT